MPVTETWPGETVSVSVSGPGHPILDRSRVTIGAVAGSFTVTADQIAPLSDRLNTRAAIHPTGRPRWSPKLATLISSPGTLSWMERGAIEWSRYRAIFCSNSSHVIATAEVPS